MKALEILETLRDEYIHGELTSDIEEAIKELEELQNRTCSNCKHKRIDKYTQGCMKFAIWFGNDFCCNKWEVKK